MRPADLGGGLDAVAPLEALVVDDHCVVQIVDAAAAQDPGAAAQHLVLGLGPDFHRLEVFLELERAELEEGEVSAVGPFGRAASYVGGELELDRRARSLDPHREEGLQDLGEREEIVLEDRREGDHAGADPRDAVEERVVVGGVGGGDGREAAVVLRLGEAVEGGGVALAVLEIDGVELPLGAFHQ